jgi:hypothetical protein
MGEVVEARRRAPQKSVVREAFRRGWPSVCDWVPKRVRREALAYERCGDAPALQAALLDGEAAESCSSGSSCGWCGRCARPKAGSVGPLGGGAVVVTLTTKGPGAPPGVAGATGAGAPHELPWSLRPACGPAPKGDDASTTSASADVNHEEEASHDSKTGLGCPSPTRLRRRRPGLPLWWPPPNSRHPIHPQDGRGASASDRPLVALANHPPTRHRQAHAASGRLTKSVEQVHRARPCGTRLSRGAQGREFRLRYPRAQPRKPFPAPRRTPKPPRRPSRFQLCSTCSSPLTL